MASFSRELRHLDPISNPPPVTLSLIIPLFVRLLLAQVNYLLPKKLYRHVCIIVRVESADHVRRLVGSFPDLLDLE